MNTYENQKTINLKDIQSARDRINPYIFHTPLLRESSLDIDLGCQAYVKPEMLQLTGAFKIRGALSSFLSIPEKLRKNGIITSSSGNHGQACAYVGKMFHVPVKIIVPQKTPELAIKNAEAKGAVVEVLSPDYDERWNYINEQAKIHKYNIIHPFENNMVAAGQGTIGLEILEDLSNVNTIVVPLGGGGLISGISTAVKEINSDIRVIGIQPENSAPYYTSRNAGHPTEIPFIHTIANGLACRKPGIYPYKIIEKNVDEIITVDESQISDAIRLTSERTKLIAEPSSCVGIAASMYKKIKTTPSEKVVYILTSGNWDLYTMGKFYKHENVDGIL